MGRPKREVNTKKKMPPAATINVSISLNYSPLDWTLSKDGQAIDATKMSKVSGIDVLVYFSVIITKKAIDHSNIYNKVLIIFTV